MSNERILKVTIGCMDSDWEKEIKRGRPNNLAENSNERAERRWV